MIIEIGIDGTMKTIYTEKIDLKQIGKLNIKRASHVEPDDEGNWIVDLTPIGGSIIDNKFKTRDEALKFEVDWIENNILNK